MSNELERLSDSELDVIFAVEVAGYVRTKADTDYDWHRPKTHGGGYCNSVPKFSTDANAVLPWLEKYFIETEWCSPGQHHPREETEKWRIRIPGSLVGDGRAPTFARAACIALIRAKRAQQPSP